MCLFYNVNNYDIDSQTDIDIDIVVRLSVCLSHASIVTKRLNLSYNFLTVW